MSKAPNYFSLSKKDKIDALETAATKLGRPSDLLEKDIWVVWALNALFDSELGDSLVFKGGTSLSKVYKAIDRFSEDVDLTYDIRKIIPDIIGDIEKPYPPNRSQGKKWTAAIEQRLSSWVEDVVRPLLQRQINEQGLGVTLRREQDKLFLDYAAVRTGTGYIRPTVLLEFGARSTGEPAEHHPVTCDVLEALDGLVLPKANPRVMSAERTFWEKATAIHAYCLRGEFRGGDRYARHWYDLDCLDQIGIAESALKKRDLASDVAEHKQHFFRETDKAGTVIDYQAAVTSSIRLIPTGEPLKALEEDYGKMIDAGLFQSSTVSFSDLMNRLSGLQDRVNTVEE